MELFLYDDDVARRWEPFALTRPAGELRLGAFTQKDRAEAISGLICAGHLADERLLGFDEPGAAPVPTQDRAAGADLLLLSSRVVLDAAAAPQLRAAIEDAEPLLLLVEGEPAGAIATAGAGDRLLARLDDPGAWADAVAGPELELPGRWLRHVWQLVGESPEQTARDIRDFAGGSAPASSEGIHILGEGAVVFGDGVSVEPGVVFDTRHGAIWLQDGVEVRAFSRVAGPTVVGPRSILLGGPYEAVSLGPVSRIHGEVEESVVLGYSNKAHDGFLGHAYLGRWVNLGALTTNSDLKNNYGTIRLALADGEADTGARKLGCFLGDHVKTGIGMMLNTGTIIGAGTNLYGSVMPPKRVPAFAWGTGDEWTSYGLDRFLDTARTVMGRRDVELGEGMAAVLERAWHASAAEREHAP